MFAGAVEGLAGGRLPNGDNLGGVVAALGRVDQRAKYTVTGRAVGLLPVVAHGYFGYCAIGGGEAQGGLLDDAGGGGGTAAATTAGVVGVSHQTNRPAGQQFVAAQVGVKLVG